MSAPTDFGDVTYMTLTADDFFGMMALSREPDPGSVVADGTTTVLRISTKAVDRLIGFRVEEEHEYQGLDLTVHAESAYDHGVLGHGAPLSATATQKVKS